MAQLQDVLSPSAYGQLIRLQTLDLRRVNYQFLEVEFADALRELEHVESVTAALFRAVLEMKRSQARHDGRIVQLEEEIRSLQGEITSLAGHAKLSYKDAEGALRREEKDLAQFKIHVVERMDTMQSSLGKTERNVTVLQSQWSAHQGTVDDLVKRLFPTQDLAQFLAAQYSEMKAREDVIWSLVKQVREEVHELTHNPFSEMAVCDEISGPSLEVELQDVGHDASCPPVSSLVVDDDGWYRSSNDRLLDSTAVGTPSSTPGLAYLSPLTQSDDLAVLEHPAQPGQIHVNALNITTAAVSPCTSAQDDDEQDVDAVHRSTPASPGDLSAILPLTPIPFNEQKEVDVAHPPSPALVDGCDGVPSPCGAPPREQKDVEVPHLSIPIHVDAWEIPIVRVHPPTPTHSEKGEDVNIVRPSALASLDAADTTSPLALAPSNDCDVVLPPAPACLSDSYDIETTHPSTPMHPDGQEIVVAVVDPASLVHFKKEDLVDVVPMPTRADDISVISPSAPVSPDGAFSCSNSLDAILPPTPACTAEQDDAKTADLSPPSLPDGQEMKIDVVPSSALAPSGVRPLAPACPNKPADAETTLSTATRLNKQENPLGHLPATARAGQEIDVHVGLSPTPAPLDAGDVVRPPHLAPSNDRGTVLPPPPAFSKLQEDVGVERMIHAAIRVRESLDKLTGDVALRPNLSPGMYWFVFVGSAFLVATFMWRGVVGRPPSSSQYPMWDWASSKA